MANTLLTISMITREALRVLENNLTFTKRIQREYDKYYAIAGAKIGTTLNIRKPPRFAGRVGQALSLEDSTETSVPLTLSTQRGVDIFFSSQDLELYVDDFSKRFIRPAVIHVANGIDYDGTLQTLNVYNQVGTPGTFPATALLYLQAGQRLDEEACPRDNERQLCIAPGFVPPIVDALKGLFQSSERISEQYESGEMGQGLGFHWYMDQNMRTQTAGAGGTGTVSGAGQTGYNLVTTGWAASTAIFNAGDIFTIPGVYAVNPQNHQPTSALRQFVVTSNVTSAATGTTTIPIYPQIQTWTTPPAGSTGPNNPYATVNALPANGAALTLAYTAGQVSSVGCAFHSEAFAFACADLLLPGGVDMASRVSDDQLGMSVRLVRAYDINQDRFPTRLDILYGFATLYQEMACRIAGG
jgi:hypothetical protein